MSIKEKERLLIESGLFTYHYGHWFIFKHQIATTGGMLFLNSENYGNKQWYYNENDTFASTETILELVPEEVGLMILFNLDLFK